MSGKPAILNLMAAPTTPAAVSPDAGLDDSLRFEDLSDAEKARVANEDSWGEAVLAAVWLLHGDRAAVSTMTMPDEYAAFVVFARGGSCYAASFGPAAQDWPNRRRLANGHRAMDVTSGEVIPADIAEREQQVAYALDAIFGQRDDVVDLLRESDFTEVPTRMFLAPLITAWWTERMDDLMPPQAAWTMLGLLLPLETFQMLSPPAGMAPPSAAAR